MIWWVLGTLALGLWVALGLAMSLFVGGAAHLRDKYGPRG